MSHPYHHALSCVKKWGGEPEDYLPIHNWFDASKESHCHFTHRALRHHAEGIFEAERVFGVTITLSTGKKVPVRLIGELHVREDCGNRIPNLADWLGRIRPALWMSKGYKLSEKEIENATIL